MKKWSLVAVLLAVVGCSLYAQAGDILWQDNFDDDEEFPLTDVGWFFYCDATIPGNEVKQMDGQLYIKSGNFEDRAAIGIAQTNGVPFIDQTECEKPSDESIADIIADDYSSPNHELTFQVKFKTITSSIFLAATRCVMDPSQLSADPQVSPAYVISSNPLEGKLALARYDEPGAAFSPETWNYFGVPPMDFAFQLDVTYSYRLYLNEGDIKLKVWEGDFDAEPVDWTLLAVDADPRVTGHSTVFAIMGMMPGDEILVDNVTMRDVESSAVAADAPELSPAAFRLYPNYPNPFNPSTEITFDLKDAADLQLTIYNQNGRVVRQVADGFFAAGHYRVEWNGADTFGAPQPSGLYYARLTGDGFSDTIKMVLLR